MVEARCDKQRIGKTGAPWECSWRKLIGSPTAVYLLPNSRIRRRLLGPRAVRYENIIFVTRSWRRFCGAVSERTSQIIILTKIAPVFARAARGGVARKCLVRLVLLSARLCFFTLCPLVTLTNDRIFGANDRSVLQGYRFRFCGNMCAVISVWPSYSPHITVLYVCLFSMPNLPVLWIWRTLISKALHPLSFRYDNPYGFVIDL